MGFLDSLKKWFSSEAAEVKSSVSTAQSKLETEMDRREADLAATPEQRLETIQSEIDDDPFAAIRNKIDGTQAHADAVDELDQLSEKAGDAGSGDVLDAEIVPDDPAPPAGV